MFRSLILGYVTFSLLVASGCGTAPEHEVSGTVTLDNQPLKEGTVYFILPTAGRAPPSAPIENGSFTAKLPVGKYRVEIRAPEPVPESERKDLAPKTRETIPARYNANSEYTVEVTAGGTNQVKVEMKSE